jgi:small-conductance mechanosensitive channel/CRP-like cAMP-binding protein
MHTQLAITIGILAFASAVLWIVAPIYRPRLRPNWLLLAASLVMEFMPQHPDWVENLALAVAEVVAVRVVAIVIFRIILHRAGWPVILTDVAVVGGYAIVFITLLVRVGINVSGLLATSALLAGIVGLALQEVLGNLIGGVAIHADGAIHEGVWIKTEHGTGRVTHIRLRHTAIETADQNIIVIPNSSLTKASVTILSTVQRVAIRFRLSADHRPTTVSRVVEQALSSPLEGVASDPKACCFIVDFQPQHIEYLVHAWVTTPGFEEAPVSRVLGRIYFALARSGMPVASVPSTIEFRALEPGTPQESTESVVEALRSTPIWSVLSDQEMSLLAGRLKAVVHGPGEAIVRQGEDGSSMFLITRGSVAVTLNDGMGNTEHVATLSSGDFFGEMSLLTGEKRTATVTAAGEVECIEMHKADVSDILLERPELAREISSILERRQDDLASIRERMQHASRAAQPLDLLGRIQRYFSMDRNGAGVARARG